MKASLTIRNRDCKSISVMQFQGYIYTPVPFLYIYGRYTLHFFGNDSSPISPNVRPSVRPKVTNLDITSFVQYN